MQNILLVFTGGTIESTTLNRTIKPSSDQRYKLLDLLKQSYPEHQRFNFKTIQPIQLLSENLFPFIWETLITAIEKEKVSQYDGIVITHGTDTLAYTAAAISLYFNSIKIPLMIISSGYPLDHPLANGLSHLICALEFIHQRKEAGVFVPYKNQNTSTLIHIGTRIASSLQLSGDFMSVQSKAYLQFDNNSFFQLNTLSSTSCINLRLQPLFSSRILLIKPYPGLDYSHFNLDQVDAVIHDLYHSGTACSTVEWGEKYSLQKFIQQCNKKNIMFYMAPAVKNSDIYHSTKILLEQGAKMIWNMSLESAYVKLLLAYGNFNTTHSIDQFLEQTIALEHIDG